MLYISGYDNTHVVQKYVVENGHALLAKPFTVDELQAKIESVAANATSRGAYRGNALQGSPQVMVTSL